jgi:hypothetical protein
MPCIRFRVDNKALSKVVGLRTGSNAVSASRANSFYSLRYGLGQLWYLMHFLMLSGMAVLIIFVF